MAWASVGSIGTAQEKLADTAIVLTLSAAAEAGNVVLVAIAIDNNATTDGDFTEVASVVDSQLNSYNKIIEQTNGQGVAADGITCSLWYSKIATTLAIGATITVTTANTVTSKAVSAWEFTVTAGATVSIEGTTSAVGDGADPAAMTISGLADQEYLWFAAHAVEAAATGTYAAEAGYTLIAENGTTGGGAATNIWVTGAFLILSATTDTYDASTVTDRDHAQVYAVLKEAVGGASVVPILMYQYRKRRD
jgi:hypothetical protein